MMYGVKQIAKYLLGTDIAGRNLAVRTDDTFIVSYPRSGNTWTRFLIANLLYPGESVSFANIERLIPDAEGQSSRYLKRLASPRVIKSHQYFDHRYPRVIYIVRDPRDVVLSYYNFSRKYGHISDDFPLEKYASDFVKGRLNSTDWGTWAENVATWIAARDGMENFLLLRYEDLTFSTETELLKVTTFLGLKPGPRSLAQAIENSSADRMRKLEKINPNMLAATRNKRPDIPFVGSAGAGTWKKKLSAATVAEIEAAWGPIMTRCSYELTSASLEASRAQSLSFIRQPI